VASPSDRLAELRAALLELEACVAKYRGVRVPRRGLTAAAAPPTVTAAAEPALRVGAQRRLSFPRLRAVIHWWRRSVTRKPSASG